MLNLLKWLHYQHLISVVLKLLVLLSQFLSSASITCSCFCSFIHLPYSFISGITLLGTPTEVYVYGIQYIYIVGGVIAMGFIMASAYLPVFHSLQLTSAYEVNLTLYYFTTRNIRTIQSFRTLKSGLTIKLMLIWPSNVSVNSKVIYFFYIIIKSFYFLWSIGHPWRASRHCSLQLSPWPLSMIFLRFLSHPLLFFATFSSAYFSFYIPEDSNLMQFSLLLLFLSVMCVRSNSIFFLRYLDN